MNYIFSAERSDLTDFANAQRSLQLREALKGKFEFIPVMGSYKGQRERSVIVRNVSTPVRMRALRDLAFAVFDQESVLIYNPVDMAARLLYADGSSDMIGTLTRVSKEEAEKHDAWTRVRRTQDVINHYDYFVAVKS